VHFSQHFKKIVLNLFSTDSARRIPAHLFQLRALPVHGFASCSSLFRGLEVLCVANELPALCCFSLRGTLCSLDQRKGVQPMEWTTPQHEEIDLNCEISSYANAEI
jgi:hypothetical protein